MKVFSAKAADQFPPSRACDHAINLKPGFVPKAGKRFPVTAEEEAETDKFIQENLDKGFIRPSKSPQTSSLFYVAKKDGTKRPVQDYRYLNDWTIKNAYPIPLQSELMDQLQGAKWFTTLDIQKGYNNICIKDGDQ